MKALLECNPDDDVVVVVVVLIIRPFLRRARKVTKVVINCQSVPKTNNALENENKRARGIISYV